MPIQRLAFGATVFIATSSFATTIQAEGRIPPGFEGAPYSVIHQVAESEPQRLSTPLVIDLATGKGAERCRDLSTWTGKVTYLNTDRGTLVYAGTGQGCITHGIGILTDESGGWYFGGVTTYTKGGELPVMSRDRIRVGVKDGNGRDVLPALEVNDYGKFEGDRLVQNLSKDAGFVGILKAAQDSLADPSFPRFTPEVRRLLYAYSPGMRATPIPWTELKGFMDVDFRKVQPLPAPLVIDMATGAGSERCPATPWTGEVTYLNTEVGTLRYWGIGERCYTYGVATVQYPDGRIYFGKVSTLLRGENAAVIRGEAQVAVPNGWGQFYDPATGAQQMGIYVDGKLKFDHRAEPSFHAAMKAVQDSVANKAAPVWTPAMNYLDWEWKAPQPLIPTILTSKHESVAKLLEIAKRYIDQDPDQMTPTIKPGLFGDKCLAPAGSQIVLPAPKDRLWTFMQRTYVGEQQGGSCLPEGVGRIDYETGARWIGGVTAARTAQGVKPFALPHGLGWYRDHKGLNRILRIDHSIPRCSGGAGGYHFAQTWQGADFDDEGRVVYYDKSWAEGDGCYQLSPEHAGFAYYTVAAEGTLYLPDGSTLKGQFEGFKAKQGAAYLFENEEYKLRIWGRIDGYAPNQTWSGEVQLDVWQPPAGMRRGYFRSRSSSISPFSSAKQQLAGLKLEPIDGKVFNAFQNAMSSDRSSGLQRDINQGAAQYQAAVAQTQAEQAAEKARAAEEDRERQQMWANAMSGLQRSVAEGNARMADTQRTAQGYVDRGNEIARQKAEQDRLNREEAARQERDRKAGEQAYAEAQARSAQAKAQAEAAYQRQRQIDQARAQAATNDAARRAAGAYGSGSGSSSPSSSTTSSSSAAPAIPAGQAYSAIKDECGQLGRDLMSAKYKLEQRCLRPKRDDETFGAWRDFQNTCMAEGKGEVEGLQVKYDACGQRDPSEGGVVRY